MATRYPCPNPSCVHEFDAEQIIGVAAVTCPQCGMVIQLRASPPGAASVPPSPAAPANAAGVPLARPVQVPRAIPVASTASGAAPTSPPAVPAPASAPVTDGAAPIIRARRKQRDRLTVIAQVIAAIMLGGLAVGVVLALLFGFGAKLDVGGVRPGRWSGGDVVRSTDFNITFNRPGGGWQDNDSLRDKLQAALIALQRREPPAWLVFDARDFKDHDPTPIELDEVARTKLAGYFGRALETEPPRGKLQAASELLGGQQANVIVFQGEVDGEHVAGECYSFHFQGIGYWVYAWKPGTIDQRDDAEFPKVRKHISLLGERQKWKELEQRRQVFTGTKVKGYQLIDATGRWQPQEDPSSYDAAADLVLFAPDPRQPKMRSKGTELLVLSLPASKDALVAAKAYVLNRHKRDFYEATRITPADEEGDVRDSVGEAKGQLARWRIQNTPSRIRFALVGVVPRENDILVLYADCAWESRNSWEGQMQAIMDTLKLD